MGDFQVDGGGAHQQAVWRENAPEGAVTKAKLGFFPVWFSSCLQICLCQLGFRVRYASPTDLSFPSFSKMAVTLLWLWHSCEKARRPCSQKTSVSGGSFTS